MPDGYEIDLPASILEMILSLEDREVQMISARLARLERDPWAGDVRCLQATDDVEFRVRADNYRIIYAVDEECLVVTSKESGLRRDVYRRR